MKPENGQRIGFHQHCSRSAYCPGTVLKGIVQCYIYITYSSSEKDEEKS